jgi:hypothetical protein
VRNAEIGKMDFSLKYFEEVFTTQHWMVRIYRVRDKPMRDRNLPNPLRAKVSADEKLMSEGYCDCLSQVSELVAIVFLNCVLQSKNSKPGVKPRLPSGAASSESGKRG